MKVLFCIIFIAGMLAMALSFSDEQEFIKQPKEKKICLSKQQLIEQEALIVDLVNELSLSATGFLRDILIVQRQILHCINSYVDGEKDCLISNATKKQRIALSENMLLLKAECEKAKEELLILRQKITTSSMFLSQADIT